MNSENSSESANQTLTGKVKLLNSRIYDHLGDFKSYKEQVEDFE